MSVRRINFAAVPVEDQDRALAFYRDALGFAVQVDAPYAPGWRWIFLTLPGAETRLTFSRRSELRVEGPALALVCDDVDAEAARLRDRGAAVTDGPADAPWTAGVRYAMIRDTEDNLILLESRTGA